MSRYAWGPLFVVAPSRVFAQLVTGTAFVIYTIISLRAARETAQTRTQKRNRYICTQLCATKRGEKEARFHGFAYFFYAPTVI